MHLLLLKQKSHTTDFFCPPLRNLINASALQSFPSLSPFFAPHFPPLLFHLSFFPSLYNPFFHTQSQNMASAHFLFPELCLFTFPYPGFFPCFVYSLFLPLSEVFSSAFGFAPVCFLSPYPAFPLCFLLCLSASLLNDSFLPFLRQKQIR